MLIVEGKTFTENWDSNSLGLFRDYGLNYIFSGIKFFVFKIES